MQTRRRSHAHLSLAVIALGLLPSAARSQTSVAVPSAHIFMVLDTPLLLTSSDPANDASTSSGETPLPESPAPQQPSTTDPNRPTAGPGHLAPRNASASDPVVSPGQIAPNQTVRDKVIVSIKNSISPFALAGDTISAGYSHLLDSSPNYGTDGNAFAQRFGAAVARGSSQNIFSSGVLAPILREDPRYYQLGRSHSIVNRGVYAATRVVITRNDSGRNGPNLALLGGYLGAAALTQTYYPPRNTSASQIAQTYAGSLGGAALGYIVNEFLSDTLQVLHLKKIE